MLGNDDVDGWEDGQRDGPADGTPLGRRLGLDVTITTSGSANVPPATDELSSASQSSQSAAFVCIIEVNMPFSMFASKDAVTSL